VYLLDNKAVQEEEEEVQICNKLKNMIAYQCKNNPYHLKNNKNNVKI
jgi:hypothetical protein